MKTTTNRRKVLVPLATLLAAGAIAVGSGADFTSTTNSAVAVTAGNLKHSNTADNLTLNITKIKPGDTVTGSLTIKNTGDLDSTLTIQETDGANTFTNGALKLDITQTGVATPVYSGNFGGMDDTVKKSLGELPVGASTTLTFAVSMPQAADNDSNQGKTAGASYRWVSTQKAGTSSLGLGWPSLP